MSYFIGFTIVRAPVSIFQKDLYIDASNMAVVLSRGPLFIPRICNAGMDLNCLFFIPYEKSLGVKYKGRPYSICGD